MKTLIITVSILVLEGCSTVATLLTAPGNLGNSITSDYVIVNDRVYESFKYPE